ncbi:hypothetical protein [Streptomyces sp. NPDC059176]|uniref:hypothetical protein n=1 Tax=unclassified Streptomyces TaxID=2593676 RepID=UPI003681D58C
MKKLAWAARGISAVSGALLAGVLVAPSAVADSDPFASALELASTLQSNYGGSKCGAFARDFDSDLVDDPASTLFGTEFRTATDRWGHAFLNDSRNPGVWVNLGLVPGAPGCVAKADVAVSEANPGQLVLHLLTDRGYVHRAQCVTDGTAFSSATIVAACSPGFLPLPGAPVG